MLNPDKDRIDYGNILKPPVGYRLDFAVGTTYSLDLDALFGACLFLSLAEDMDSEIADNPIYMLESLRQSADNIAIFCEGGQIHVPSNASALYIFLEKMVFPVITGRSRIAGGYPSFHPKVWVVKYVSDGERDIYRFIVMSRNLTYDRSWDVVYSMDGTQCTSDNDKNEPLSDFLLYLAKKVPGKKESRSKKNKIRQIARELLNVEFKIEEKIFRDYEFIPTGFKAGTGRNYSIRDHELFNGTFHEIFVMSPFLSNDIIKRFNEAKGQHIEKGQYTLLTRPESLSRIEYGNADNFDIYILKDDVVNGESGISDEGDIIKKQDIHAKMFLTRKYSNTDLYLGSLNATRKAAYGNIEFMIRLNSTTSRMNSEILKKELFRGDEDDVRNPFMKVDLRDYVVDEAENDALDFDNIIKEINRAKPQGHLQLSEEKYSLNIVFGDLKVDLNGLEIALRPITMKNNMPLEKEMTFPDIPVTGISEMFVVSVSDGDQTASRVIMIPIDNIPEEREKEIVSSIVANKKVFYNYVAFLLGEDAVTSMLEIEQVQNAEKEAANHGVEIAPALYEKMLKAAVHDPDKLKGIDYLISMISKDGVIPEEFEKLYDTVKKAVGSND